MGHSPKQFKIISLGSSTGVMIFVKNVPGEAFWAIARNNLRLSPSGVRPLAMIFIKNVPGEGRTPGLQLRRLPLYPTELRTRI